MNFCYNSYRADVHAHEEGIAAEREVEMEYRAEEILEEFFDAHTTESAIDEDFATYFEEEGVIWDIVKVMDALHKGKDEEALDVMKEVSKTLLAKAEEMAIEKAGGES